MRTLITCFVVPPSTQLVTSFSSSVVIRLSFHCLQQTHVRLTKDHAFALGPGNRFSNLTIMVHTVLWLNKNNCFFFQDCLSFLLPFFPPLNVQSQETLPLGTPLSPASSSNKRFLNRSKNQESENNCLVRLSHVFIVYTFLSFKVSDAHTLWSEDIFTLFKLCCLLRLSTKLFIITLFHVDEVNTTLL